MPCRADRLSRTVKKYPHNKYLGWRIGESPYKWMSYNMAHTRAKNIGSGLRNLGLKPVRYLTPIEPLCLSLAPRHFVVLTEGVLGLGNSARARAAIFSAWRLSLLAQGHGGHLLHQPPRVGAHDARVR